MMDEHAKTIARPEAEPVVHARWIEEPTGAVYRKRWSAAENWEGRAAILRKAGVRFFCEGTHKSGTVHMYLPPALQRQAGGRSLRGGSGAVDGIDWREEGARRYFLELRRAKGLGPGFWYSPS
ncbi:hypothetical protein QQM39_20530 [Streptomyces sp. DT2A-34]|uniref:hypothetical protein n=1 Tax=Streptomyces sp. DT2A-34 TaxID=3051182 RepID=UPI00265BF623|nr:hypothetical protein [Streptomyces sp. DT2A-34]MDO0913149.1 hypothetical protein [Streptomyces sp. DT2A-34]